MEKELKTIRRRGEGRGKREEEKGKREGNRKFEKGKREGSGCGMNFRGRRKVENINYGSVLKVITNQKA